MIPSLLQIPSAVSDSKLHSVLPNNGKGDFTFDRSTGATRINKDGLIEEVGYFSSELVQNGDFSELGSEIITNGDFTTNTNWGFIGTARINDGCGVFPDTTSSFIFQSNIFDLSVKTYKLVYSVKESNSGTLQLSGGNSAFGVVNLNSSIGTHTFYLVSNGTKRHLQFFNASSFVGKIDNVSVKQVDPNDRWNAVGNSTLNFADFQGKSQVAKINITDTATGSRIRQPFNYVSGTKYKISVEVYLVSGSFRVDTSNSFVNVNFVTTSTTGSWITLEATFDAISTGSHYIWLRSSLAVAEFYVSNISIVEVQGDRPRLSYDITNGVVEDKPHLLLEPSSSNVVVNSKQTNTWTYTEFGSGSAGTITTGFTDMMGETNAIKVDYPANADNAVVRFGSTTDSLTSGTATYSMYIKLVEAGSKVLQIRASTGILQTITVNSTEFKRYSVTGTKNSNEAISLIVRPAQGTSSGGFSVVVCCPQGEAQSYATSYIPTAGTTITRAAETCNNSKPSINSTEGVLYAEIAALADDGTFRMLSVSDGTNDNRVRINYSATSEQLQVRLVTGGVTQADLAKYSTGVTSFHKAVIQYKANEVKLYVDGSLVSTDTSASVPSAGTLNVVNFDGGNGANIFYGKVNGLAVYNEALSESQLMQLTGVTASSIYSNFVTRTASFTVEALNEVKKVIDNL